MVNAREIAFDIAFQHLPEPTGIHGRPFYAGMRPFSFATCIGIKQKGPVKNGFNDIAQRMMHHTVTEGGSADQPWFFLANDEGTIGSRLIRMGAKFLLQTKQFRLQLAVKRADIGAKPFPTAGSLGREQEIREREDVRK